MAKGETLKATLEELRNSIPELKGVLLASNEGLPIAHALTNGTDPNRLAAMAAAASTLGRKSATTLAPVTWAKFPFGPMRALCSSMRPAPKRFWRCSARKMATPV